MAESAARARFIKDQKDEQLDSYAVGVMDLTDAFDVEFELKTLLLAPLPPRKVRRTGGSSIHYLIEKGTYRVIGYDVEPGFRMDRMFQPVVSEAAGSHVDAASGEEGKAIAESVAREQFKKGHRFVQMENYTTRVIELINAFDIRIAPKINSGLQMFDGGARYFVEKKTYRLIGRALER